MIKMRTNEQLWQRLLKVWRDHQDTGMVGIQRIWVDLVHIKNHHIKKIEEVLDQLLRDDNYKYCIHLSGAPVHILESSCVWAYDSLYGMKRMYRYIRLSKDIRYSPTV